MEGNPDNSPLSVLIFGDGAETLLHQTLYAMPKIHRKRLQLTLIEPISSLLEKQVNIAEKYLSKEQIHTSIAPIESCLAETNDPRMTLFNRMKYLTRLILSHCEKQITEILRNYTFFFTKGISSSFGIHHRKSINHLLKDFIHI